MSIVIVKPLSLGPTESRLGYEKEGYTRVPGTTFNFHATNDRQGRPKHGLSYLVDNPKYDKTEAELAKEQGKDYTDRDGKRIPEKITKREELESRCQYNLANDSEFWHEFKVRLTEGNNVFDTTIPEDDIRYHMCKASDLVANSEMEFRQGKCPNAVFVIVNDDEELSLKEKERDERIEALDLFSKLNPDQKRQLCRIIGMGVSNQTDKFVSVTLGEFAENNYKKFLSFAKKPKERIQVESLLQEAVEANVVRIKDKRYFRGNPEEGMELGFDFTTAADFLANPKNTDIRQSLANEVSAKKNKRVE